MQSRWPLVLCLLALVILTASPSFAYPYCSQITCSIPPVAHCSDPCWECNSDDAGTEYNGDPGTCDNPTLITAGDIGCPCLQSTPIAQPPSDGLDLLALLAPFPGQSVAPQISVEPAKVVVPPTNVSEP